MTRRWTGVVVGVDLSDASVAAAEVAAGQARRHRLRLVYALESPGAYGLSPFAVDMEDWRQSDARGVPLVAYHVWWEPRAASLDDGQPVRPGAGATVRRAERR